MKIESGEKPIRNSENKTETKKVSSFETAKGSVYTYLPDGRVERFKKATNETSIQDVIVFIPDWKWFSSHADQEFLKEMESGGEFEEKILSYVQDKEGKLKVWIINEKGEKINKNEDLVKAQKTFLYFGNYEKADFVIPVTKVAHVNYKTFDTKKYQNEEGEWKRESHIGNPVVKINYEN